MRITYQDLVNSFL